MQKVLQLFPLSDDVRTDEENYAVNAEVYKLCAEVRKLAKELPLVAAAAELVPELSPILSLGTPFQSFPGFELALDTAPFDGTPATSDSAKSSILNLRVRWSGQAGEDVEDGLPVSFLQILDVLESCKAVCEELRYGRHALEPRIAAAMAAALIEHTFTSIIPLPQPWQVPALH